MLYLVSRDSGLLSRKLSSRTVPDLEDLDLVEPAEVLEEDPVLQDLAMDPLMDLEETSEDPEETLEDPEDLVVCLC